MQLPMPRRAAQTTGWRPPPGAPVPTHDLDPAESGARVAAGHADMASHSLGNPTDDVKYCRPLALMTTFWSIQQMQR